MERVNVVNVTERTSRSDSSKKYYEVQLKDGRKANSFDKDAMDYAGQDVNVEINTTKKGDATYYNLKFIKEERAGEGNTEILPSKIHLRLEVAKMARGLDAVGSAYFDNEEADKIYNWIIQK